MYDVKLVVVALAMRMVSASSTNVVIAAIGLNVFLCIISMFFVYLDNMVGL